MAETTPVRVRENAVAATLRELLQGQEKKTRNIPEPLDGGARFEVFVEGPTKDSAPCRYRVEVHEVDAGVHAKPAPTTPAPVAGDVAARPTP